MLILISVAKRMLLNNDKACRRESAVYETFCAFCECGHEHKVADIKVKDLVLQTAELRLP
jgi:hypothetical protein